METASSRFVAVPSLLPRGRTRLGSLSVVRTCGAGRGVDQRIVGLAW